MRTKRRVTPRDDRRRNGPVTTVRPDPGLFREALFLAGGDPRRVHVEPDGTVTVANMARREDPARRLP